MEIALGALRCWLSLSSIEWADDASSYSDTSYWNWNMRFFRPVCLFVSLFLSFLVCLPCIVNSECTQWESGMFSMISIEWILPQVILILHIGTWIGKLALLHQKLTLCLFAFIPVLVSICSSLITNSECTQWEPWKSSRILYTQSWMNVPISFHFFNSPS